MTKSVRIENADTSEYEVVVELWDNDQKITEHVLDYPTAMLTETLYNSRHLVIRERKKS